MTERQWEQVGAATGVTFVAVLIVSVFIAPAPPHIDASTSKILTYYADHRRAILAGAVLNGVGGILFLWFLGHLRHVLQRAEGGVEALSPIVFGAGVATVAAAVVCILPQAVLAFASDSTEIAGSPAVVRLLYDLNTLGIAGIMMILGLFVGATALAMVLKELVSPVLGWAGLVVTVVLEAAGIAGYYTTTYSQAWTVVSYAALLSFAAFVLVASVAMLATPETSRQAVPIGGPILTR
jgi:hypothetical protein